MYELGSVYQAALDVFDENRQPANPDTAVLTLTLPDQSILTPPVTLPPAVEGQLRLPYVTTQPGRHLVNWRTTGPVTAYSDVFDVMTAAPPAIISLADAKQTLSIDPRNTDNDDELRSKLRAITQAVERYMNTVYAYRTVTERFERAVMGVPWGMSARLRLTSVPVIRLTSLVSLGAQNQVVTTYDTAGDLWTDAETGLVHRNNGPQVAGRMDAVYTAGMVIIPENVIEGSRVLLQAVWETRRGPGGVNGVVGPEEMSDFRHYTALPRKVTDWLGQPRPVIF
jgi:hypothetical protein